MTSTFKSCPDAEEQQPAHIQHEHQDQWHQKRQRTPRLGLQLGRAFVDAARDLQIGAGVVDQLALLGQRLEWSDGIAIEVAKIKRGKVTAAHVAENDDLEVGQPYVIITVNVANGSDSPVDLLTAASLSYGPDGEQAADIYLSEDTEAGVSGGVLPSGRSRSGFFLYLVPEEDQDDVVLGLTPSLDHDEAVLTGSLV